MFVSMKKKMLFFDSLFSEKRHTYDNSQSSIEMVSNVTEHTDGPSQSVCSR